MDSQASLNYLKLVEMNRVCVWKVVRGEKETLARKNLKILDE